MIFSSTPAVCYDSVPIALEAELLHAFVRPGARFGHLVQAEYPALVNVVRASTSDAEALAVCRGFAEGERADHAQAIADARDVFQARWDSVGNAFLRLLAEHMQTDWPIDKSVIRGYVSINPVAPRFLRTYSFMLSYRKTPDQALETTAHEIVHFLWFKKWKEIFPEIDSREFESPHLVWRLSEIIDPVILHAHPEIRELIHPTHRGYRAVTKLMIGDVGAIEYFTQAYTRSVRAGDTFADTMRSLWEETQRHRDILAGF